MYKKFDVEIENFGTGICRVRRVQKTELYSFKTLEGSS